MKKLFAISLFLVIMLALGVSAASISLNKVVISRTAKPTAGFSDTFTITNNGTTPITNLKVNRVGTDLNDFNISTSPHSLGSTFTLTVNQSVDIDLTGTVPEDVTTKEAAYSDVLKIYSGSTELGAIDLNIIAEGQLRLDNVKARVDGDKDSLSDGDNIRDVKPGSRIIFEGDIENRFSDDDDIEIEDVEIEITIERIDDEGDDDLEDSEDVGDINADDEEGFSIEFQIPEDVDDGEYDVVIIVEGEDENNAKHSIRWELTLEVEKDKHDVLITKSTISPSKVSCSRNIKVNVELKNQGRSDEDEVVLRIENLDLDIDYEDTSIPEIEEGTGDDTEYDKSYQFEISDKVKAGTYPIKITVYYDTDEHSNDKTIDLKVEKCDVEDEPEEDEETVVVVSPPSDDDEEGLEILTSDVTETTEVSLLQSNTYMMLLMGAVGIAVIVIIVMVVILFSVKKRKEQI